MKFWSRIRLNLAFFVDFLIIITNSAFFAGFFFISCLFFSILFL